MPMKEKSLNVLLGQREHGLRRSACDESISCQFSKLDSPGPNGESSRIDRSIHTRLQFLGE